MSKRTDAFYIRFRIQVHNNQWACPRCEKTFNLKTSAQNTKRAVRNHLKTHHKRNGRYLKFWVKEDNEEKDLTVEEVEALCKAAQEEDAE